MTVNPKAPLGPAGHFTRARVDSLPIHPQSEQWVQALTEVGRGGADGTYGRGELNLFTGRAFATAQPAPGYPVNVATRPIWPLVPYWWSTYGYFADNVTYPDWQSWASQQGWDNYCMVMGPDRTLYELIGVDRALGGWIAALCGRRRAGGGVRWDPALTARMNNGRPVGVCAAAWPLAPLVLRQAELDAGIVQHPLHVAYGGRSRGGPRVEGEGFVWPARHHDTNTDPAAVDLTAPPYGAWFRLRADYPNGIGATGVIIDTLKRNGMLIGDGVSRRAHGIAAEPGIPQQVVESVWRIPLDAFQAVDVTGLRVNPKAGIGNPDYWRTK